MPRIVQPPTYLPLGEPIFRRGNKQLLEPGRVLVARVEPTFIIMWVKYYRHPVMQRLHELVPPSNDDGAAGHLFLRAFPYIPQPCECKRRSILHADVVGHLDPAFLVPFVETVGRDDATVALERSAECGLGIDRLGPRIDRRVAALGFLRPRRYQSPVRQRQMPTVSVSSDDGNVLRGRDVVAWRQIGHFLQVKCRLQRLGIFQSEASAHIRSPSAVHPNA